MKVLWVLAAALVAVMADDKACDLQAIDECAKGIYYSTPDDDAYHGLTEAQLDVFCRRVETVKSCLLKASKGCPDKIKTFIQATIEGYNLGFEDLCNPEEKEKRQDYLKLSPCLHTYYGKHCMLDYIKVLEIVQRSNMSQKTAQACCQLQYYTLCLEANISKSCGEKEARFKLDLVNNIAQPPLLNVCGRYLPDTPACKNFAKIDTSDIKEDPVGNILSRHAAIILEESSE